MRKELLLDTDIFSEIIKDLNSTIRFNAVRYEKDFRKFQFTSFTVFEVLYGLYRKSAIVQIERVQVLFSNNLEIVPETADFRLAARIIGELSRHGTPIGVFDPLIAACAINRNMPIATGNTKHYQQIIDLGYALEIENWRE